MPRLQCKNFETQTCNLTDALIEPDVESALSLSGGFTGSYLTFFSLGNRERWFARLNFDLCEANCILHRRVTRCGGSHVAVTEFHSLQ